jgi:hypothetical protein
MYDQFSDKGASSYGRVSLQFEPSRSPRDDWSYVHLDKLIGAKIGISCF